MAAVDSTTQDIHNQNEAVMGQVEYLGYLFNAISRLSKTEKAENAIEGLAKIGDYLSALLHNDVDIFDENFR